MGALQMEFVPKFNTDSYLNAIMRFIALRTKSSTIISDNVTKFVETEIEFAVYVAAWIRKGIEEHLFQRGIRWKLKPPEAPHF